MRSLLPCFVLKFVILLSGDSYFSGLCSSSGKILVITVVIFAITWQMPVVKYCLIFKSYFHADMDVLSSVAQCGVISTQVVLVVD